MILLCLKFESDECPCKEYNAKAPKTYEEKWINQLRSIKAKWLKRRFKQNLLDDDFKSITLNEKSRRLTQKQIKSKFILWGWKM